MRLPDYYCAPGIPPMSTISLVLAGCEALLQLRETRTAPVVRLARSANRPEDPTPSPAAPRRPQPKPAPAEAPLEREAA